MSFLGNHTLANRIRQVECRMWQEGHPLHEGGRRRDLYSKLVCVGKLTVNKSDQGKDSKWPASSLAFYLCRCSHPLPPSEPS